MTSPISVALLVLAVGATAPSDPLKSPDPGARVAAIESLAKQKGRTAVPQIAPFVEDRDEGVAVRAVATLFELGGEATLAPIRKALRSPSARVRTETAQRAGDSRALALVGDLGRLLEDHLPGVRRTTVEALRAIRDRSTYPFLVTATSDEISGTAASAIAGLEDLGDARALPRIAQLAGSSSVEVRAAAAHAIPALSGLTSHAELFARLTRDADPLVRRSAAAGLRRGAAPEAMPALVTLSTDADASVRRMAIVGLQEQASPQATAALISRLKDADDNVRAAAVLALGARPEGGQASRIAAAASDPAEGVRVAVASTLGDVGRPDDLETLRALAADPRSVVRATAVVAAARVGASAALPIVEAAAKDSDAIVRLSTVRALSFIREPAALPALRGLASAGDLASRIAAIEQLGARKDTGSVALLRKIAQDPVEKLRSAARRALEAIGA